jgi:hypothetical protein
MYAAHPVRDDRPAEFHRVAILQRQPEEMASGQRISRLFMLADALPPQLDAGNGREILWGDLRRKCLMP